MHSAVPFFLPPPKTLNVLVHLPDRAVLASIFTEFSARPLIPPFLHSHWQEVAARPLTQAWFPELRQPLEQDVHAAVLPTSQPFPALRATLLRAAVCALLEPDEAKWLNAVNTCWQLSLDPGSWEPAPLLSSQCLAAAELTALLCNLFGEVAPDDLLEETSRNLRQYVWEPFLEHSPRYQDTGGPLGALQLRNAHTHLAVLSAALSVMQDHLLLGEFLGTAIPRLVEFMDALSLACRRGVTPAGSHPVFARFCLLNGMLETRTCGKLSLLEGDSTVRQLALKLYGGAAAGKSKQSATPQEYNDPALLAYLGGRLEEPALHLRSQADYTRLLGDVRVAEAFDARMRLDAAYPLRTLLHSPPARAASARKRASKATSPRKRPLAPGR